MSETSSSSSSSATAAPPAPVHGITPPGNLDLSANGNIVDNWKAYKQVWSNYSVITNLDAQTEKYRVALFLHCIGPEALKIYNGFAFDNEDDKKSLDKILEKFDQYAIGELNETYERYQFNDRSQQPEESIDSYVTALRNLAKTCNFCQCLHDSLIRDRIVFGIRNLKTRRRLLQERNLDLKKCIDICRSAESTESQMKAINNASSDDVHKVKFATSTNTKTNPPRRKNDRNVATGKAKIQCRFCGDEHEAGRNNCPAWGEKCRRCGGRNHFQRVCRKSNPSKVHGLSEQHSEEDSDDEYFVTSGVMMDTDHIHAVNQTTTDKYPREIYAEMMIVNGDKVTFQIDCGAAVNILSRRFLDDSYDIRPTERKLRMWNGSELKPVGITRVSVRNPKNNKRYSVEFVIVHEDLTSIIGARATQQMNLINVNNDNFVSVSRPKQNVNAVNKLASIDELVKEYSDVFDRPLGTLPGKVHLEVDEGIKPVVMPTRRVPTALKDQFKEELDRLVDIGVLESVSQPTPWVSGVVLATKKSGSLRICLDPRPLNKALQRENYQIPIVDEILPELSKAKVFSTVDLTSAFWHCVLDDDSSLLTTFSTPYGRFRWKRLPFGLSVSSEIFQKHINQALEGLSGVLNVTDDVLIYGVGETEEEANQNHDDNLRNLFQRSRERGIALNRNKLKLRLKEVKFMGHLFTSEGLKIDPGKIKAVKDMPKPDSVEAVQRLNGFVNYLSKFLPQLAEAMEPIRKLTRNDKEWQWGEDQDKAFKRVQDLVTQAPILSYYDPESDLYVQCDASKSGLGAALLQNGKPVAYASRALTDTETRYAQIEKEMLAIVFSLEKFDQYTFGRKVKVLSDHKPLESILKKPLAKAPRRLQGMMMRLQRYDVEVHYERGKNMHIADLLSRAYLQNGVDKQGEFDRVCMASFLPISDERLTEIREETQKDDSLQKLKRVILQGWPEEKRGLPEQVCPYFNLRDELTIQDGLVFRGQRVVIPSKLRGKMKQKIHSSHMGVESCLRRARECLYWPNMSAEVKQYIQTCETCRKFEVNQPRETLMPHEIPSRPWQRIGVDLFELNKQEYLVCVDYYSNFWEVDRLQSTTARAVILKMKSHFARYGCPDVVVSDNGPQFASKEFAKFAQEWQFEHNAVSPGNSKANGKAESAVKTTKNLLRKAIEAGTDPYIAILDYRNTPTQGLEASPVQRLMNRRTKTLLPTTGALLQPRAFYPEKEYRLLRQRQDKQQTAYNKKAKDLRPLSEGDTVRMKPFRPGERTWRKAVVAEKLDERSYYVEDQDGSTYRRNRQHLRKSAEEPPTVESAADDTDSTEAQDTPKTTQDHKVEQEEPRRSQRVKRAPEYLKDYITDT